MYQVVEDDKASELGNPVCYCKAEDSVRQIIFPKGTIHRFDAMLLCSKHGLNCNFSHVPQTTCPISCDNVRYIMDISSQVRYETTRQDHLITFDYSALPKSRYGQPTKKLVAEEFVWSDLSLIGNIGGALGLFIGFSFHGTTVWVIKKAVALFTYCKMSK